MKTILPPTDLKVTMMTHSLYKLTRAVLAAVALSAASSVANASFINNVPDPFYGTGAPGMDLQTIPPGSLVPLEGLGPNGPRYASNFIINNFSLPSTVGDTNTYAADLTTNVVDSLGNPNGGSATLPGSLVVQFVNRISPFETGTFTMNLLESPFSGLNTRGDIIAGTVVGMPSAEVSITQVTGGYEISYITPFTLFVQYTINGSNTTPLPPLGDVNGQPSVTAVPAPATAALVIPGLLAMMGVRRRRAAVAA